MNFMLYAYTTYLLMSVSQKNVLHSICLFHGEALKFKTPSSNRVFFQPPSN